MGNCQAIDAASLVIQHPCGKVDRLYWPVTADDIMKINPGHYVALLITTTTLPQPLPTSPETVAGTTASTTPANSVIRLTKVKLLKPTDMLVLEQIYRLIGTQEVMKGLMAKKHERMKKNQTESGRGIKLDKPLKHQRVSSETGRSRSSEEEKTHQVPKHEHIQRQKQSTSGSPTMARLKNWQPSLQSILEAGS